MRIIVKISSQNNLDFHPKHLYCDFEQAIFNSFSSIFPDIRIHGCYFHYTQSLYRKIQNIGLENLYKSGHSFRYFSKGLMILPLIPLECLDASFSVLYSRLERGDQKIDEFVNYYLQTWLNSNAMFNRRIWNHCYNYICRTNNFVESFHAKLKKIVKINKPNIFDLINHLKSVQTNSEIAYLRLNSSNFELSDKDKYIENAVRRFDAKELPLPELLNLLINKKS